VARLQQAASEKCEIFSKDWENVIQALRTMDGLNHPQFAFSSSLVF
jgi:hypothetical protein